MRLLTYRSFLPVPSGDEGRNQSNDMEPPLKSGDRPLLAYFGHHKCDSRWTPNMFREIHFHMGRTFRAVHGPVNFETDGSLGAFVDAHEVDFSARTNVNRDHVLDHPPIVAFTSYAHPWTSSSLRTFRTGTPPTHVAGPHPANTGWCYGPPRRKKTSSMRWALAIPTLRTCGSGTRTKITCWSCTESPARAFRRIAHFLGILNESVNN